MWRLDEANLPGFLARPPLSLSCIMMARRRREGHGRRCGSAGQRAAARGACCARCPPMSRGLGGQLALQVRCHSGCGFGSSGSLGGLTVPLAGTRRPVRGEV